MPASDHELEQAGSQLADQLLAAGLNLVTAESCTGGWVAKVLTDKAGSSAYVVGGLVTYSNDAKQKLLGVTDVSLANHGAVSEPVVREMVAGALATTGANVAVAVSGIAGPGGGSEEKPVGTVWFAWGTGAENTEAVVRHFSGDRDQVRRQAVLVALQGVSGLLMRA
ncbi:MULTISPECIES: nicotinamide-nucleotide amidohydrolase family protein [unclassified Marinobacter]|uniref:nicotinamide-nucleotide amidohydrolase family protein n=1 Tax=unclassified Marinobacter TaxID=83889 RepID=UPI0026E25930|nr:MULTISPECIES: nicotinamide-nucleotide amidohydrolase family protein [unclassified Marinobacter]MDO6440931.1 nicotinamide-nucleotide amidohydrolase family protein [Marinobacter sp. 2_MG-2023]MDO6823762.1 nicotinamide-nucleotide amidohydrolase family protein [Marinobacter sp. 1_MG-2023]